VRISIMLLPVHIAAGGLAIILGGVALAVRKGGALHRRSGILFVCAMLTMGFTGRRLRCAGVLRTPMCWAASCRHTLSSPG
jgi:uncharacterized membrane protein